MGDEEDQDELDEVHEALEAGLHPTDSSSLVLQDLLLEYLVHREVCYPQSEPARDYA